MQSEKATKKSISPRLHALAVANVDKLFASASIEGTHPDTHNRKEVRQVRRLGSIMRDPENNSFVPVMLTVIEYQRDGERVYTIEAIDVGKYKDSAGQLTAVTIGERHVPIAEFVNIIAEYANSVNPDAVSKVVDENGEPKVVYHGTPRGGFTVFGDGSYMTTQASNGYWFSDDSEVASTFMRENRQRKEIFPKLYYNNLDGAILDGLVEVEYKVFDFESERDLSFHDSADQAIKWRDEYIQEIIESAKEDGDDITEDDVFVDYGKVYKLSNGEELSGDEYSDNEVLNFINENIESIINGMYDETPMVYYNFLNIRNPKIVEANESHWDDVNGSNTNSMAEQAEKDGYDGIIFKDIIDGKRIYFASTDFVVFSPTQIKSATDNVGTWDGTNPDIRFEIEANRAIDEIVTNGQTVIRSKAIGDVIYGLGKGGKRGRGLLHIIESRRKEGASLDDAAETAIRVGVSVAKGEATKGRYNTFNLDYNGVRAIVARDNDTKQYVVTGFEIDADEQAAALRRTSSLHTVPHVSSEEVVAALKRAVEKLRSLENSVSNSDTNNNTRFEIQAEVTNNGELVAVHNTSLDKLSKSLGLGGLPMPSIAITKPELGHNGYGDATLVFDKSTIDPSASRYNKVYSGDAWTPTYPTIDNKLNEDKVDAIAKKVRALLPSDVKRVLDGVFTGDAYSLSREFGRHDGDVYRIFRYDNRLKYVFLKDSGIDAELPKTEKGLDDFGKFENGAVVKVAEALTKDELQKIANPDTTDDVKKYEPKIRKALKEYYKEKFKGKAKIGGIDVDKYLSILGYDRELSFADVDSIVNAALRYLREGIEEVVDYKAAKDFINSNIDEAKYKEWLLDLFDGIIEKEGIRNDKDTFTPSGKRRTFEQLHFENTIDNVLSVMRKQNNKGVGGFGGSGIFGASTHEYKSISGIKDDSGRLLSLPHDEMVAKKKEINSKLIDLISTVPNIKELRTYDSVAEVFTEAIIKYNSKPRIAAYIKQELKGWGSITDEQIDELLNIVREIKQLPTRYFEAKPQRIVGFDEVVAAIVPQSTPDNIVAALEQHGANIVKYDDGNEEDRKAKLNNLEGVRFEIVSAREDAEYMAAAIYGDTETAQRMVDEAARRAGATGPYGSIYTPNTGIYDFLEDLLRFGSNEEIDRESRRYVKEAIHGLPDEAVEEVLSWKRVARSPYGDSFYNTYNKTWTNTPDKSLRLADHWNFVSQARIHCKTNVDVEKGHWILARYDKKQGKYIVIKDYGVNEHGRNAAAYAHGQNLLKTNQENAEIDLLNAPIYDRIADEIEGAKAELKKELGYTSKSKSPRDVRDKYKEALRQKEKEIKEKYKDMLIPYKPYMQDLFVNIDDIPKSLDPITYDDDGNIIPLSKRFNRRKDDVRWEIGSARKEQMRTGLKTKLTNATDEQVEQTISEIEALGERVKKGGNPKVEKTAFHCAMLGTIILPEDEE